ncbi:cell wall metabolism sensor histidine kinase WalK [Niallia sp. NCCP-28]|uniref:sensor histidine kinase n=1 Tax=Niallia sp. NCCP-28 TaxID=2934712 RepID=UPI002084CE83|nr:HAMP domain-containing sensor histidine kinase [Niallia sp. NCCP-28]GKU84687.1 sensor histidine kinase YclK [Niallia sp. NCCP-28]
MRIKYIYQQLISHISVIIVAFLVVSLVFTHYVEKIVLTLKGQELLEYGVNILDDLQNTSVLNPGENTLYNYANVLGARGISFGLFDTKQNKLVNIGGEISITNSEWNKIRDGKGTVIKRSTYRSNKEVTLVAIPYKVNGEVAGGIVLTSPLSGSREMISQINRYLVYTVFFAFGVALLLSFLLSQIHVKRIKKLQEATSAVAVGNYDVKVPSSNFDEIGELANDFNSMVDNLKESKEAIDALENRRRQFMSDVSHELRTPLTTISGVIEGLTNNMIPEVEKERGLRLVSKEAKRLIRLVNENLDYDKIRSNQVVLMKENIQLQEVLEIIQEQLYTQAEEKRVKIHIDVKEDIMIFADYDRLIQIIINITKNSIQFTENGSIWLRGYENEEKTVIEIEDTGIGMEAAEIENIWKRFYKADISRTNTPYGEFGLGLSIVKQLVQFHEGEIKVASEKGEGTKFTITFPKNK